MQSSSLSISEALSAEEICPLCLDHYTAADECLCVVCRAPSCPGCAETIDADGAMRCFACRPVLVGLPSAARKVQPLSLPRPIALVPQPRPERLSGEAPPLPFPLTTSPYGVRQLKPQPTGSVFVGLPPVPAALKKTLPEARHAAPPPAPAPSAAPAWLVRAQTKLVLSSRSARAFTQAFARRSALEWQRAREQLSLRGQATAEQVREQLARHGQRARTQLTQHGQAAAERLQVWKQHGAQRLERVRQDLPGYRAELLRWCQIGLARSRRLGAWSRAHLAHPLGVLAVHAISRSKALLPARTKPVAARSDNTGPVGV